MYSLGMATIKELFNTSIGRGKIRVFSSTWKAHIHFDFLFPYYSQGHVTKEKVQPSPDGGHERIHFNYTDEIKPMKVLTLFFSY